MRKVLLGLALAAAGLAGLATVGEAGAAKKSPPPTKSRGNDNGRSRGYDSGNRSHPAPSSYYREHGKKFDRGYYFSGRHHDHWGHRKWDGYRRCYVYYEPALRIYYYYDRDLGGYYPCD